MLATRDYREQPVYWFAILDSAREREDYETAAHAEGELRRLGITVKFHPRRPSARKAEAAAR